MITTSKRCEPPASPRRTPGVLPRSVLRGRTPLLGALVLAAAAGCGSGSTLQGPDGGAEDDAALRPDSGNDAQAGRDSGSDPNADVDRDGYPTSRDCNDHDRAVYPGVVRDCASDCDTGTQVCQEDGTWSECTAASDCACSTPGETRLIACGNCGQATQECGPDLIWATTGPCTDEGPCQPGAQDYATCDYCGSGLRTCQSDCTWGPPDCTGVCTPGERRITMSGCAAAYERQELECAASCEWTVLHPCTSDCLLPARQGNGDFKDEVCIPGGPFLMGRPEGEGDGNESPMHEVALTAYYIDQYEVTYGRFRECVEAGACVEPASYMSGWLWDPAKASWPVGGVTWSMANNFCLWDGGRSLPTEAQWEKAARGPSPRTGLNPWGSAAADCSLVVAQECVASEPLPVDSVPAGVSYYGVFGLAGNVAEILRDFYSDTYYQQSPGLDPTGPPSGTMRVLRGYSFQESLTLIDDSVTRRRGFDPYLSSALRVDRGFRCARPGI